MEKTPQAIIYKVQCVRGGWEEREGVPNRLTFGLMPKGLSPFLSLSLPVSCNSYNSNQVSTPDLWTTPQLDLQTFFFLHFDYDHLFFGSRRKFWAPQEMDVACVRDWCCSHQPPIIGLERGIYPISGPGESRSHLRSSSPPSAPPSHLCHQYMGCVKNALNVEWAL